MSKGEIDILFAVTQLIPRILEQSLLLHFLFTLNGKDNKVRFSYTKWDSKFLSIPVLDNKTAKRVQIVIDKKVVRIVNSIQQLMSILGIKSRRTIMKYMNHVRSFYSPNYKNYVNIRYPNMDEENLLTHNIIHRNLSNIPELVIPNVNLFSLIPNELYVYNSSLSLIKIYKPIREAAKDLNPNNEKLGINVRGREIAISRSKNKKKLVYNELGSFYFAENPNSNRWIIYQQGLYPLILKDIINQTELEFAGIKPVQRYLTKLLEMKPDYKTIRSHYNNGTLYKKRFIFIPISKNN